MTENQIGRLLAGLWSDIHEPAILWQAGALAWAWALDYRKSPPTIWKEPEPTSQILQLAGSGVDLELGICIRDPERGSQNVRSDISVDLLSEFNARRIEIPFPQREVRMLRGNNNGAVCNSAES